MHAGALRRAVTFSGCDNEASRHASWRPHSSNLPSVFPLRRSILPGHYKDQALGVVTCSSGWCERAALTENELGEIERRACRRRIVRGQVHTQHDGVRGRGRSHSFPGSASGPASTASRRLLVTRRAAR